MERSLRPWLDSDLVFNLSALGRENQRCVKILHDFTNQVIQDRKQMLNNNQSDDSVDSVKSQEESPSKFIHSLFNWIIIPINECPIFQFKFKERRLAFLDLLIQASENGDKLSDDDIREEVDTFMFAVSELVDGANAHHP